MPKKKLTSAFVNNVSAPKDRKSIEYFDELLPSFGLRVTKNGVKSWVILYRIHGRQRRYTIGRANVINLSKARDDAKELLVQVANGIDPAEERQLEKEAITVNDLSKEFIGKHVRTLRRDEEVARLIKRDVLPKWGNRRAKDITKRDVIFLLDKIVERPAPYVANRVKAAISKMYNWAIERDILDINPALNVKKPTKEIKRDRYLTTEEIQKLWGGLVDINPIISSIFKVLLLTGQRKSEVCKMRWQYIQGDWWTIPAEFSKNKKAHRVYLSKQVKQIINSYSQDSEWVFASTRRKGSPLTNIQKSFEDLRSNIGVEDIRIHDMRRTVASHMASIGIPSEHISKVLNHSSNSVTAIYNRHDYDNEKQEAFIKWAEHLVAIVNN